MIVKSTTYGRPTDPFVRIVDEYQRAGDVTIVNRTVTLRHHALYVGNLKTFVEAPKKPPWWRRALAWVALFFAILCLQACSSPAFDVAAATEQDAGTETAPETAIANETGPSVDAGTDTLVGTVSAADSGVTTETGAEVGTDSAPPPPDTGTPASDSGTAADTAPACEAESASGTTGTCYPQGSSASCPAPCGRYAYKCLGADEAPPGVAGCTVMAGAPAGWLCCVENKCVRTASTDYICLSKYDDAGSHAPPHNYQCPPGPTPTGCVDVGAAGYCCP